MSLFVRSRIRRPAGRPDHGDFSDTRLGAADPADPVEMLQARDTARCPRCGARLQLAADEPAGTCTGPRCGFAF